MDPLTRAGLLLGLGLGGFIDGIVLHQILQWHHLLSSRPCCPADSLAGLQVNTLADGLFHLATWMLVVGGLALLWRHRRADAAWPGRRLAGLLLAGWGAFNLVEGLVDHHLLGIHHVKPGDQELLFDLGFLMLGAVLVAAGLRLARPPGRAPVP